MTTIPFLRNSKHTQQSGVVYSADRKTLIHCPKNYSGDFEIPIGVETIGIEAFAGCKRLTAVIFPASLKEIKMLAFANCIELKSINAHNNNSLNIAEDAFKNCDRKALQFSESKKKNTTLSTLQLKQVI